MATTHGNSNKDDVPKYVINIYMLSIRVRKINRPASQNSRYTLSEDLVLTRTTRGAMILLGTSTTLLREIMSMETEEGNFYQKHGPSLLYSVIHFNLV